MANSAFGLGVSWGGIGGTLADQTDLVEALDLKVPTSRILTIGGVAYDLSADRTWTINTLDLVSYTYFGGF